MKNVIYLGNNLKQKSSNISYIGVLGPLLEQEGYQVFYASSNQVKLFRLLEMLWSVFYNAKKLDFVLIDTYSTQNFYYALLVSQACRLLGIPYIPILHGGHLTQRLVSSPRMSALIFKNAVVNIAPSHYLKQGFEACGYLNLRYIPNVIELSQYLFLPRTYHTPKLLWVRAFAELYNPMLAIKVLKNLRGLGYDASLCMVGPDSDGTLKKVQEFAQQQEVEVQFPGKLTKQAWVELSKEHNVFINTTNVDNTPLSVIEAMALGLPIVSTNVGGMPYLIENEKQGLLVAKDDVDAMTSTIISLFDNGATRERMVLNARALAESFDWEVVKYAWVEVLK